ncbi:hypothetical protein PT273_08045 [Orbaceae bacterium ESL0727]|nr:hypothetical protein [Orbaceae bacterium ESL0727]
MTKVEFRMTDDDLDLSEVTQKTLGMIKQWLKNENIHQTAVQEEMLNSHVSAMVGRAKSGEKLPEVDPALFTELSAKSLQLAKKTVALFNNLPIEEAYLLAVHYDVALANGRN